MQTMVYGPTLQTAGTFDGGKITEQKPIGFPGENSVVKRVGPLFYWAWAKTAVEGYIPLHPHQAFEIMTYVVSGQAQHGDTLGTRSTIGAGGVQLMQTGSGVSHEERFVGPDMEGFQIWFEPHFEKALKTAPTYNQYEHEQFPEESGDGYLKKTVIGDGSPLSITVDARMWDVVVDAGRSYSHPVSGGRALTALAIRGGGTWLEGEGMGSQATPFNPKDFIVARADDDHDVTIKAGEDAPLRLILIDVPTTVDYPLYPKR
ncbi:pirin family protein [Paenibacillus paeoniae]|uniref:Pirin n=1 Tax=Paenibacillus paeoniae TaxID=2292705 RepID=A0A371P6N7_9BACL|nr:pirin family protein [Paenibacillus paeoniae]REK71624.1 pirin [Paenibacillus paeoniae]